MERKRGLMDFLATCLVCTAVYLQTPVGGLIDRAAGWVFDLEREPRRLTSFFTLDAGSDDEGPSAEDITTLAAARREIDPELAAAARRANIPYTLLRAMTLAGGNVGIALDATQRREAAQLLGDATLTEHVGTAGKQTLGAAALVQRDSQALGDLDAGLAAFILGRRAVERAIEMASLRQLANPARFASHKRYYSREQRHRARPFVEQIMAIKTALEFAWPIAGNHRMSSPFGYRQHPILGVRKLHNGVDLAVKIGTPVLAAHDGDVLYSVYDSLNGNYTKIDHGYGLTTAYCHNSQVRVAKDTATRRGDVVALSGNTGRSTGPHLHYVIRIGRRPVDPMLFR